MVVATRSKSVFYDCPFRSCMFTTCTCAPRKSIKLPILQLLTLDGQLCHWPAFWEQFKASVHENKKLTKEARCPYQNNLLSGAASASISGLQAIGECYDDATEILKSRLGDKRGIVQENLRRLRKLPAVASSEDVDYLRRLLDYVQCHIRGLKGLNVSPTKYASMMMDILLKALPADIVIGYCRKEANS
ncbi:hypothetical protein HPB49_021936 [Dermacentor silvarum]|uniref:Uncharacterized protein n=1 Tax=Dermacentor silvarum TaxID=543639 RepID=A0ACB8C5X8_DERSI|nr:hypothetical protein HPB49_021936 [Dermacentor silvarum]